MVKTAFKIALKIGLKTAIISNFPSSSRLGNFRFTSADFRLGNQGWRLLDGNP